MEVGSELWRRAKMSYGKDASMKITKRSCSLVKFDDNFFVSFIKNYSQKEALKFVSLSKEEWKGSSSSLGSFATWSLNSTVIIELFSKFSLLLELHAKPSKFHFVTGQHLEKPILKRSLYLIRNSFSNSVFKYCSRQV